MQITGYEKIEPTTTANVPSAKAQSKAKSKARERPIGAGGVTTGETQPEATADREDTVAEDEPVQVAEGVKHSVTSYAAKKSLEQKRLLDLERFKRTGERSGLLVAEKVLVWSSEESAPLLDAVGMFKADTEMTMEEVCEIIKEQARKYVSCAFLSIIYHAHATSQLASKVSESPSDSESDHARYIRSIPRRDLGCLARVFLFQFVQDMESFDDTTASNRCFGKRQVHFMHKVYKPEQEQGVRESSIKNLSVEGSSVDAPTVEIQVTTEDETAALKNSDKSYCGSYTALENAIYRFVNFHYALNIYDDKAMDEFFAGM